MDIKVQKEKAEFDVPNHVPQALVEYFDYYADPQLKIDPIGRFNELGRRHPEGIFYSPRNGGFWVITSYDKYCEAATQSDIFSSELIGGLPLVNSDYPPLPPISFDPPDHAKFRLPVSTHFSRLSAKNMEADIETLVASLVEGIRDKKSVNFIADFAEPLPITIFMKLMGLPISRLREFRDWAIQYLACPDPVKKEALRIEIMALMEEIVIARKQKPENDIISHLHNITIDDRPITHEELLGYCFVFFLAGLDTVVNAVSYAVLHLAKNPDMRTRIANDPSLASPFVEETLRRYSFTNLLRTLDRDIVFHGVEMKRREPVILSGIAANLDPNAFDDPMTFDINRKQPGHVAFATGPHHCLGAPLARVEMRIAIQQLCSSFSSIGLANGKAVTYSGGGSIIGIRELELIIQ